VLKKNLKMIGKDVHGNIHNPELIGSKIYGSISKYKTIIKKDNYIELIRQKPLIEN
jgi:hypothetical protein